MKKQAASRVLSRACAAIGGGYLFATVVSVWLIRTLPLEPAVRVMTGLLSSFLLYLAAVIWVFAARSASRAWAGILIPVVLLGGWAWALGQSTP